MIKFLERAFLAIGLITLAAALCVIIGFLTEAKAADLDAPQISSTLTMEDWDGLKEGQKRGLMVRWYTDSLKRRVELPEPMPLMVAVGIDEAAEVVKTCIDLMRHTVVGLKSHVFINLVFMVCESTQRQAFVAARALDKWESQLKGNAE